MSGLYLGLEGVEGAGKSTVARLLAEEASARGREVVLVREPGGTWLGERIRGLVLHGEEMAPWAEAALFAAQRAQLTRELVVPALDRGAWVVSDRTYYSSLAYQGAARGLGVEAVRRVNETVLAGVEPDVVVVLDVDPAVGLSRQRHADRIGGAGVEFQRAVAEGYRGLAREEPERVLLLEAGRPAQELTKEVLEIAESRWRR